MRDRTIGVSNQYLLYCTRPDNRGQETIRDRTIIWEIIVSSIAWMLTFPSPYGSHIEPLIWGNDNHCHLWQVGFGCFSLISCIMMHLPPPILTLSRLVLTVTIIIIDLVTISTSTPFYSLSPSFSLISLPSPSPSQAHACPEFKAGLSVGCQDRQALVTDVQVLTSTLASNFATTTPLVIRGRQGLSQDLSWLSSEMVLAHHPCLPLWLPFALASMLATAVYPHTHYCHIPSFLPTRHTHSCIRCCHASPHASPSNKGGLYCSPHTSQLLSVNSLTTTRLFKML